MVTDTVRYFREVDLAVGVVKTGYPSLRVLDATTLDQRAAD